MRTLSETFGLQLPRALTHGVAPDLIILQYKLLQSFQYKNELLLLRELKKPFVILASIALTFVHYSYSRVHNSVIQVRMDQGLVVKIR